jgi:hypothetical protein
MIHRGERGENAEKKKEEKREAEKKSFDPLCVPLRPLR